jgi:hypothetical protein
MNKRRSHPRDKAMFDNVSDMFEYHYQYSETQRNGEIKRFYVGVGIISLTHIKAI